MQTSAMPAPPAASPAAAAELPAFAHREAYDRYFHRLAESPEPEASLRRLLSHVDADLAGTERVGLWWALWRCVHRLDETQRATVARCLDGRHAARLALLSADWRDARLIESLAAEALQADARDGFVPALLQHHGLRPLEQPDAYSPRLVLLAAMARLRDSAGRPDAEARLGSAEITRLHSAALQATARDDSLAADGLVVLFELALQARDEDTATATLAQLLLHNQGHRLRADRVRAWLDGTAFIDHADDALPLCLAAQWQQQWLQPTAWMHRAMLAAVAGALQREAPRRRLHTLMGLMDFEIPEPAFQPRAEALRALAALDGAWAMAEAGADPVPLLQPVLDTQSLAPAAIAAAHRASVRVRSLQGDVEGVVLALARARRAQPSPGVRRTLLATLPMLDPQALPPLPELGADWRAEEPFWKQVLRDGAAAPQRVAAYHLALLWTHGALEPRAPQKCQRLEAARELWAWLAGQPGHPDLAEAAADALRSPALAVMLPALQTHGEIEHLWVESPGAQALTIVFSCVHTHHTFPDVQQLSGRLPGQSLLFLRNPDRNWYTDQAFEQICTLVRDRVLPRFDASRVSCYYGSMGGHGALKVALEFGFRAIVFNPQTDLDLWASFRAGEREQLWSAERHAQLGAWPVQAWQRMPLYYACGSASADREALSAVIARLRRCPQLTAIVEKFADPQHAGLMNRIASGPVATTLQRIGERLDTLQSAAPAEGAQALDGDLIAAFWDALDAARQVKVEIQVREGRLWWQPSRRCGTRGDDIEPPRLRA